MSVLKVKDYYSKPAVCVQRNTTLGEICKIILKDKFTVIPVCDTDGKFIGIVTINEIMSVFIPEYLDLFENITFAANLALDFDISEFIDDLIIAEDIVRTDKIPDITEDTNLIIAVSLLNQCGVTGAPVVKDDKVVGIITMKDILSGLIEYKNSNSFF